MSAEKKFYSDTDLAALYKKVKSQFPNASATKAINSISYIMAVYLYKNEQYLGDYWQRTTLNGKRKPPVYFPLLSKRFPLPKE